MSEINSLIFDTNSTLFNVLDGLEVPALSTEIQNLKAVTDNLNDLLVQLGRIVDANQLTNNTKFVETNTRIDNQQTVILGVQSTVTGLQATVEDLFTRVSQMESVVNEISDLSGDVVTLKSDIIDVNTRINATNVEVFAIGENSSRNTADISVLKADTVQLKTDVISVNNRINTIDTHLNEVSVFAVQNRTEINLLKSRATVMETMPGVVTGGVKLKIWNQSNSNGWLYEVIINKPFGFKCRVGEWYSCVFNGTNKYIQFLDAGKKNSLNQVANVAVYYSIRALYYTDNVSSGPFIYVDAASVTLLN